MQSISFVHYFVSVPILHCELQFAPLLAKEEKEALLDRKIADMRRMNTEKGKPFQLRNAIFLNVNFFCARIDVQHCELQFAPLLSKEEKEALLDRKIADMLPFSNGGLLNANSTMRKIQSHRILMAPHLRTSIWGFSLGDNIADGESTRFLFNCGQSMYSSKVAIVSNKYLLSCQERLQMTMFLFCATC